MSPVRTRDEVRWEEEAGLGEDGKLPQSSFLFEPESEARTGDLSLVALVPLTQVLLFIEAMHSE